MSQVCLAAKWQSATGQWNQKGFWECLCIKTMRGIKETTCLRGIKETTCLFWSRACLQLLRVGGHLFVGHSNIASDTLRPSMEVHSQSSCQKLHWRGDQQGCQSVRQAQHQQSYRRSIATFICCGLLYFTISECNADSYCMLADFHDWQICKT